MGAAEDVARCRRQHFGEEKFSEIAWSRARFVVRWVLAITSRLRCTGVRGAGPQVSDRSD